MFEPTPATGVTAGQPLTEPEDVPTIARTDARTDARPRVREAAPVPVGLSPRERARLIRDVQADALSYRSALDRMAERRAYLLDSVTRATDGGLTAEEVTGVCAVAGLPPGTLGL